MRALIAVAIMSVLALAGCTSDYTPSYMPGFGSTYNAAPVASAIKTYDKTFTSAASTNARPQRSKDPFSVKFLSNGPSLMVDTESAGNKPYFIEFRARNALSYGHASVVFGKLDSNGRIPTNSKGILDPRRVQISGLHPATDDPAQWVKGHSVPVPAETGPSDGDFEDAYVTARYQVNLTEQEFRKVVGIINRHKNSYAYWYAPNYASNCLGYIGSIAKEMGLKVPTVPTMPKYYVQQLKALNA
ncbi:MAG: hypothetical protein ACR2O0_01385 [Rhizobiaceae bacterium]